MLINDVVELRAESQQVDVRVQGEPYPVPDGKPWTSKEITFISESSLNLLDIFSEEALHVMTVVRFH